MEQEPVNFGIDVYRLYEAHCFDLERRPRTHTHIEATWRAKHNWQPPSETKKEKEAA
jgi:hypothetical protein